MGLMFLVNRFLFRAKMLVAGNWKSNGAYALARI